MLNAETPRLKFALYGAHDDLGSALLVELLSRQHEAVALLDDLNSLSARPGLRTKPGDPFDPLSVSESVAGMDAVICLYHTPRLPSTDAITGESARRDFYQAVEALLLGLERVGVERLLLIADFPAIERQPEVEAALQRLAAHPLKWTLVDAPPGRQPADHRDVGRSRRQGRNQSLSRAAAHRCRYRGRAGAPAAPASAHPFS